MVPALLLLSACGDDETPAGPVTYSPPPQYTFDDASAPPTQLPATGWWRYSSLRIVNNTCGIYAVQEEDRDFALVATPPRSFTIPQAPPWEAFSCDVSGDEFRCPERLGGEERVQRPPVDVTLRWNVAIVGRVVSPGRMEGTQWATVACEGSACSLAQSALGFSFPCGWGVDFEAVAR